MGDLQNLTGIDAVRKIKELTGKSRTCLMITAMDKRPMSVRPMTVQKTSDSATLYFFVHKNAEVCAELKTSDEMHLTFSDDNSSQYLSLYGYADLYRDQKEVDEMYTAFANSWFEGKEDPNLQIIRFNPDSGSYWDTKHGKIVQMAGILLGAITGKQMDNGVQGDIKL